MIGPESAAPTTESEAWMVRLECGHEIAVPWGTQPPLVLAFVVQHEQGCEAHAGDDRGPWFTFPALVGPRSASFR